MDTVIKNLEMDACLKVLGDNYIGRLAFIKSGQPYIIPITYFHDREEDYILSYSSEGVKIEAMRAYDAVAFQVDEVDSIQNWRSVLIHGKFEELEGSTAKLVLHKFAQGVQETISKTGRTSPKFIGDFSSRLSQRKMPIVYRINISEISGKYRNDHQQP
ncbi:MAG: pyridoxamine 5'-phosphate oxidase family protein [Flavobacteriaceae bacterium]